MLTVTASEANQNFSRLLSAAEGGEEVVITRRGKPAARMSKAVSDDEHARRSAALQEALAHYATLKPTIAHGWTRESLYDEVVGLARAGEYRP